MEDLGRKADLPNLVYQLPKSPFWYTTTAADQESFCNPLILIAKLSVIMWNISALLNCLNCRIVQLCNCLRVDQLIEWDRGDANYFRFFSLSNILLSYSMLKKINCFVDLFIPFLHKLLLGGVSLHQWMNYLNYLIKEKIT